MDFLEAERLFRQLREQHRRGTVSGDAFAAEVGKIQVSDDHGRQWMIGVRSGNWYYLDDNGEWTVGDPHTTADMETRCLQCGQPLELGKGICDSCIAAAIAQVDGGSAELRAAKAEGEPRQEDGAVRLAFTVLGLILACVFLFVFQMIGSRWLPSSPSGAKLTPAAALIETEEWPPLPLPTSTPEPLTPVAAVLPQPTPTAAPPATATPVPATVAVASSTPPASPTVPPALTGRLIFPLFDEHLGTYDLYVASVGSGEDRRLLLQQASQADVSAAGQIAFRSWNDSSRGLMLGSMTGAETSRLVSYSEAARPSWSPDGGELLFYSLQEGDRKTRLYRVSPGAQFEVVKQGDATVFGEMPEWLPDRRLVAKACPEGRCGLYVMGLEGGTTMLAEDAGATAPAASPDGRTVAFMSQRDGNWEIYTIGADGQGLARLTYELGSDGLPAWSPDGQYLAFVSDRGDGWGIWAMRPDGSEPRRLFGLNGTPDGRVRSAQSYESRGWTDERICWIP